MKKRFYFHQYLKIKGVILKITTNFRIIPQFSKQSLRPFIFYSEFLKSLVVILSDHLRRFAPISYLLPDH